LQDPFQSQVGVKPFSYSFRDNILRGGGGGGGSGGGGITQIC